MGGNASSELTMDLVGQALAGDRRALRAFVDLAMPVVQARVARTLLRRRSFSGGRDVRQEVEDLSQQVFVALFSNDGKALRAWDEQRGMGLPGFLGLLAEREVISILRTRKRNPYTDEPVEEDSLQGIADEHSGPEELAASREVLGEVVRRLRDKLTERGLEMFEWLYVDGRAVEEVCFVSGMSQDAVHAWRSRIGKLARAIAVEVMSGSALEPRSPQEEALR